MTDYTINNDDRKLLTEKLLGECWHEGGSIDGHCIRCFKYLYKNRAFTNPDDQHKVFKKLVEEDKWVGFFWKNLVMGSVPEDIAYLFINPERFNKLVADYLKEEVK